MLLALKNHIEAMKQKDEGATMIEYGLLAALIAVALIAAIILVQTALQGTFTDVAGALTN